MGIGVITVFRRRENRKTDSESESEARQNRSRKNRNCSIFFCSVLWKLKYRNQKQKQSANHSTFFLTSCRSIRFRFLTIWFTLRFFVRLCYDADSDVSENQPNKNTKQIISHLFLDLAISHPMYLMWNSTGKNWFKYSTTDWSSSLNICSCFFLSLFCWFRGNNDCKML